MTKYTSKNTGAYLSSYHKDPLCKVMRNEAKEVTQGFIDHHDLKPCWNCAGGEREITKDREWKYQNVEIDTENEDFNP